MVWIHALDSPPAVRRRLKKAPQVRGTTRRSSPMRLRTCMWSHACAIWCSNLRPCASVPAVVGWEVWRPSNLPKRSCSRAAVGGGAAIKDVFSGDNVLCLYRVFWRWSWSFFLIWIRDIFTYLGVCALHLRGLYFMNSFICQLRSAVRWWSLFQWLLRTISVIWITWFVGFLTRFGACSLH